MEETRKFKLYYKSKGSKLLHALKEAEVEYDENNPLYFKSEGNLFLIVYGDILIEIEYKVEYAIRTYSQDKDEMFSIDHISLTRIRTSEKVDFEFSPPDGPFEWSKSLGILDLFSRNRTRYDVEEDEIDRLIDMTLSCSQEDVQFEQLIELPDDSFVECKTTKVRRGLGISKTYEEYMSELATNELVKIINEFDTLTEEQKRERVGPLDEEIEQLQKSTGQRFYIDGRYRYDLYLKSFVHALKISKPPLDPPSELIDGYSELHQFDGTSLIFGTTKDVMRVYLIGKYITIEGRTVDQTVDPPAISPETYFVHPTQDEIELCELIFGGEIDPSNRLYWYDPN